MCVGASVFAQISVWKLQLSVLSGPREQTGTRLKQQKWNKYNENGQNDSGAP